MLPIREPYIIGETAFHHQGDLDYLKRLIEAASQLKLNAIKFHLLFDVDDYFVNNHPAKETIEQWIFTGSEWQEIIQLAHDFHLDVIVLCNDVASLEWINNECSTPIKAIELHATGINDVFLLNQAAQFGQTVILGIGGSTLDQIQFAIDSLKKENKRDIFLMYGFQNYPTDYNDINFNKLNLIKELFGLPVGYADHTDPEDSYNEIITTAAILKGVNVIEKHFTLDVTEKRIDSQAAVSLEKMKKIKKLAKILCAVNGKGGLKISDAEIKYGDVGPMKKAIVARRDIPKEKVIDIDDLAYKRTERSSYLEQNELLKLIGSKVISEIKKDDILNYENVEYNFKIAETVQFFNNK